MAWITLVCAGLLEVVWAVFLKQTGGFTRFWPSLVGIGSAVLSFVLLGSALKTLPVGTAYAVWVGIGTLGVAIAGIFLFSESTSLPRILCLLLILIGIAGLKLIEG
jgi:quaternary ammonium compound-resistance protein SugE